MLIEDTTKKNGARPAATPAPPRRSYRPKRGWRTRDGRAVETVPFGPETDDASSREVAPRASSRRLVELNVEATHHLEGFELRSVARVAAWYYSGALAVLAGGVVLAWLAAVVLGLVGRAEEFMRSIGFREFTFVGIEVIFGGILLALAAMTFLTTMTVVAAACYNLLRRPGREVGVRITPVGARAQEPTDVAVSVANGNGAH